MGPQGNTGISGDPGRPGTPGLPGTPGDKGEASQFPISGMLVFILFPRLENCSGKISKSITF